MTFSFILVLLLSDDQLAGPYYWTIDLISASLWGAVIVILVYSLRSILFVIRRARRGFKTNSGSNSKGNIRVINSRRSSSEDYGIYLSTVISFAYLCGGILGLSFTYLLYKKINTIASWIGDFSIGKTTISAFLDLLRPGLGRLLNLVDWDELVFFLLLAMIIVFLSIALRGFESLATRMEEIYHNSDHKSHPSVTLSGEFKGIILITRDLFGSAIFGDLRQPILVLILHICLAIVFSIPPLYFLYFLFM